MGFDGTTDYKGIKVKRWEKNGKISYTYNVGTKEGDTWLNETIPIRFKGSPDIPDGTIVHCKEGFEKVFSWVKDGKQYQKFGKVITNYEYDGMADKPTQTFIEMPDAPDSFSALEDEIPF